MPRNEAIERLLELERARDLWSSRPHGYPVWTIQRLLWYRLEHLQGETERTARANSSVLEQARSLGTPFVRSVPDVMRLAVAPPQERDIWVLSATSYRRQAAEGGHECIFAQHLLSQLGDRVVFIERNSAVLPRLAREDVVYWDAPILAAMLMGQAVAEIELRVSSRAREQLAAFAPLPAKDVLRDAVYGRLMLEVARRWIARRRPAAVFVLCGYSYMTPFQLAAREAQVPLIELQHGIIHDSHPGYVHATATVPPHVADQIVVFGPHFGEVLERCSPYWRGRWHVGGHLWLANQRRSGQRATDTRTLVAFSQNDPAVRRELARVLVELVSRLSDDWRVVLKPHPREPDASTYYRDLRESGVEVLPHTEDSYSLLASSHVSLAVYSTVAIEALAFGCRSLVLRSPLWPEDIRTFVEQGQLIPVDGAEAVARECSAEWTPGAHEALASDLFGIGHPAPDFAELIRRASVVRD